MINKIEILSENIDVCDLNPCLNGGTCVHGINYTTTYICKCDVGYVGQNCSKGIFIIVMLLTQNVIRFLKSHILSLNCNDKKYCNRMR